MAINPPKSPGRVGTGKKRIQVYSPKIARWTEIDTETNNSSIRCKGKTNPLKASENISKASRSKFNPRPTRLFGKLESDLKKSLNGLKLESSSPSYTTRNTFYRQTWTAETINCSHEKKENSENIS